MDEHGRLEIAVGEHLRDVREVHLNLIAAGGVARVVGRHLNGASIGI